MKNTKKLISFLFLAVFLALPLWIYAQKDDIPDAPKPPRLVNDFAGFLTPDEQDYLERKLDAFDDSTSTQIAIVIVKSLNGYEPNDYATRLGQKWGVGRKENQKNNGIVILVKPKTSDERGQVYIATGYGMESFVTDALSKRIVENEILPRFRNGENFEGLNRAVDVLMSLSKGQFTVDQYLKKKKKDSGFPLAALIFIVILFVIIFSRGSGGKGSRHISRGSDLPFWLLLGGLGSGRSGGGGFGGFSGGGGGGFGGFGGGSFGGGGAGGSW